VKRIADKFLEQWATYSIVSLNIIVFFSIEFSGHSTTDTLTILNSGGNFGPLTLDGQFWRLVTCMFLHIGYIHLAVNMYSLFYLGTIMTRMVGNLRMLTVYFLTGIFASMSSILYNGFVISAGASGAIFGIYGFVIFIQLINPRIDASAKKSLLINFFVYLAIILVIGSKLNFDNAAHLGGLVTGILCGALYHFSARDRFAEKLTYVFSFVVLVPLTYFLAPRFQVNYYRMFQRFVQMDHRSGAAFRESNSDEELKEKLGIIVGDWDSLRRQVIHFNKVPEEVSGDTSIIAHYCWLRSEQLTYIIRGIREESYIYQDSIGIVLQAMNNLSPLALPLNFSPPESETEEPGADSTADLTPVQVLYNEHWVETYTRLKAHYYRRGYKDSLGEWSGHVFDFYISGAIQMKGNYKQGLRNGVFLYYREDSTYEAAGRYEKNERAGKWQQFYGNNQLSAEYRYTPDYRLIENMWDSTGHQTVVEGNGIDTSRYDNGQIKSILPVIDGVVDGESVGYYRSGRMHYREVYNKGSFVRGIAWSEDGEHTSTYDISTYIPRPSVGRDAYFDYLAKNRKYPPGEIRHGEVQMTFTVTADGAISNIAFLKRMNTAYNEEAKRLLTEGPAWLPALDHGLTPIAQDTRLTIQF